MPESAHVVIVADRLDHSSLEKIAHAVGRRQIRSQRAAPHLWLLVDRQRSATQWLEIVLQALPNTQGSILVVKGETWAAHGPNYWLDSLRRLWP